MKSIKMKLQILHQIKEKNALEGIVEDYQKKSIFGNAFHTWGLFKTLAFFWGRGVKNWPNLLKDSSEKLSTGAG